MKLNCECGQCLDIPAPHAAGGKKVGGLGNDTRNMSTWLAELQQPHLTLNSEVGGLWSDARNMSACQLAELKQLRVELNHHMWS